MVSVPRPFGICYLPSIGAISVGQFPPTHLNPHRFGVPFIISWFRGIFCALLLIRAPRARTGGKTDTSFVSQLEEPPVKAKEPERASKVPNDSDVQAPVNGPTSNDTSDAAPSLPAMSGTDDLNRGNETTPTLTSDDTGPFSPGKALSHGDSEVGASWPAWH